jgi:hypothetical protein
MNQIREDFGVTTKFEAPTERLGLGWTIYAVIVFAGIAVTVFLLLRL